MYLKQLEQKSSLQWQYFFMQFSLSDEQEFQVKQILTMPTKQGVKSGQAYLKQHEIVNGLGPWWFPNTLRTFLTWLLPFLDFYFHDIAYLLATCKEDRLKADLGWRKYAFASIYVDMQDALDKGNMLIIGYKMTAFIPKSIVAISGYRLLRIFGGFSTNY